MDAETIKSRLREAAGVLRRVPLPRLVIGFPKRSNPEAVQTGWGAEYEADGSYDEEEGKAGGLKIMKTRVRSADPQGQEIDDAWEAFEWLGYLLFDDKKLVWAWANKEAWWKLAQRVGCGERTAQRKFNLAIDRILDGVSKKKP